MNLHERFLKIREVVESMGLHCGPIRLVGDGVCQVVLGMEVGLREGDPIKATVKMVLEGVLNGMDVTDDAVVYEEPNYDGASPVLRKRKAGRR